MTMTLSFIKTRLVDRQAETLPDNTPYFETDHLLPDLHRRSARGTVATLSGQGVKLLLQTLSTVVLARLLLPDGFGLVAMESAIICFIWMSADLGLSRATVQRAQITHAQGFRHFFGLTALSAWHWPCGRCISPGNRLVLS